MAGMGARRERGRGVADAGAVVGDVVVALTMAVSDPIADIAYAFAFDADTWGFVRTDALRLTTRRSLLGAYDVRPREDRSKS